MTIGGVIGRSRPKGRLLSEVLLLNFKCVGTDCIFSVMTERQLYLLKGTFCYSIRVSLNKGYGQNLKELALKEKWQLQYQKYRSVA